MLSCKINNFYFFIFYWDYLCCMLKINSDESRKNIKINKFLIFDYYAKR